MRLVPRFSAPELLPRRCRCLEAPISHPLPHHVRHPRPCTTPERFVRSTPHRHGLRFRLHVRGLSGRPDIVLSRNRIVILLHGCFWHGHVGCAKGTLPATNRTWWVATLQRNRARDQRNIRDLRAAGWRVSVAWEFELGVAWVGARFPETPNWES